MLAAISIAFGALLYHCQRMLSGEPSRQVPHAAERASQAIGF